MYKENNKKYQNIIKKLKKNMFKKVNISKNLR